MGGAANKMPEQRRTLSMAAALLICLCAGFGYAWSVIQTPIMEQHGWSGAQVSAAYPLTVLCSTMSPLLCGAVIRKLGVRRCTIVGALLFGAGLILCSLMKQVWQLYLFYGVMTGLGRRFYLSRYDGLCGAPISGTIRRRVRTGDSGLWLRSYFVGPVHGRPVRCAVPFKGFLHPGDWLPGSHPFLRRISA